MSLFVQGNIIFHNCLQVSLHLSSQLISLWLSLKVVKLGCVEVGLTGQWSHSGRIFPRPLYIHLKSEDTKSIILPPFCATSVLVRVKSYLFVENISSDYIRKENESITFVRHTHPNQKTLSPSQTHIF